MIEIQTFEDQLGEIEALPSGLYRVGSCSDMSLEQAIAMLGGLESDQYDLWLCGSSAQVSKTEAIAVLELAKEQGQRDRFRLARAWKALSRVGAVASLLLVLGADYSPPDKGGPEKTVGSSTRAHMEQN